MLTDEGYDRAIKTQRKIDKLTDTQLIMLALSELLDRSDVPEIRRVPLSSVLAYRADSNKVFRRLF